MMRTVCVLLLCAASLAGCDRGTPTAPTPAPPVVASPLPSADTIVSMFVEGGDWVVVGGAPLQVTARIYTRAPSTDLPNGEFVDDAEHVAWNVDPPGIVAVDRQGHVTAVASGIARVTATAGVRTASRSIRAVPDYTGTWAGTNIITACAGGGDPRTCGRIMFNQTDGQRILYPFSLTLSQDRDQVNGSMIEFDPSGDVTTPVTGFVRVAGTLVLEASVPVEGLDPRRITNWSAAMNAALTQISGAFTKIAPGRSFGGTPFTLRTEHEFSGVTRTR